MSLSPFARRYLLLLGIGLSLLVVLEVLWLYGVGRS